MVRLKNWSFKKHCRFLTDYGFEFGHSEGSHFFYNGRIKGMPRVVQAIKSSHESESQSDKTMNFSVKHSGIPRSLYEKWRLSGVVDKSIIF